MNKNKYLYPIRHDGKPFVNSNAARVVVTGVLHHWIYIYDDAARAYFLSTLN